MPHPDIWNRTGLFTCCSIFAVSACRMRMRMRHCGIHVFRTSLSPSDLYIFLGKVCLDTRIGRLNPKFYALGGKILDSTVRFAFAPIGTWSDPFCPIRKSHTQSHMWNHARTFACFPFICDIRVRITHTAYMESRL